MRMLLLKMFGLASCGIIVWFERGNCLLGTIPNEYVGVQMSTTLCCISNMLTA